MTGQKFLSSGSLDVHKWREQTCFTIWSPRRFTCVIRYAQRNRWFTVIILRDKAETWIWEFHLLSRCPYILILYERSPCHFCSRKNGLKCLKITELKCVVPYLTDTHRQCPGQSTHFCESHSYRQKISLIKRFFTPKLLCVPKLY